MYKTDKVHSLFLGRQVSEGAVFDSVCALGCVNRSVSRGEHCYIQHVLFVKIKVRCIVYIDYVNNLCSAVMLVVIPLKLQKKESCTTQSNFSIYR